jgi:hypothetical protein
VNERIDVIDLSTAAAMPDRWLETSGNAIRVIQKHNLDLASEFFFKFARFAYALKPAGYSSRKGRAEPDWQMLSQKLEDYFLNPRNPQLTEAITYFIEEPPNIQMVSHDQLVREEVTAAEPLLADRVLQYVRRIRNNLFHGGKFRGHVFADPERSEILMRYGLVILH